MAVFFFPFPDPTAMSVFSFSQSSWIEFSAFSASVAVTPLTAEPPAGPWWLRWCWWWQWWSLPLRQCFLWAGHTSEVVSFHKSLLRLRTTPISHREVRWFAQGKSALMRQKLNPRHSGFIFCTLDHDPTNPNFFFWVTSSLLLFILKIYLRLTSFEFYSICEELLLMCSNASARYHLPENTSWALISCWAGCSADVLPVGILQSPSVPSWGSLHLSLIWNLLFPEC